MAKKTRPYKEGDWFAVPLKSSGFGLGLIARVGTRGGIILGYFFGPQREGISDIINTSGLHPADAVLVRQFCDPGLMNGEWPVLFRSEKWQRSDWPVPAFGHIDIVDSRKAYRREYGDNPSDLFVYEEAVTLDEAQRLPADGLDGHIALQIKLTQLLSK
jgi:hypothetical protein